MKISIVTAVFNNEATIAHAIDSIAAQLYPDIEHLIIDGASSDHTMAIVNSRVHAKMRVLSEPDKGIYDALNKGCALATGEVIGLLHSDDFLAHPQVLEKLAQAFSDPDIDVAYGDLDYVAAADPARVVRHWCGGEFRPAMLGWGWMPPHPTLFVRRAVLDRLGMYDTSYRIAADYEAILRWFGKGAVRSRYIPEVLVKMRLGGASNRSLSGILRKSREDYRALRSNKMGGLATLTAKNLRKIPQLFVRQEE